MPNGYLDDYSGIYTGEPSPQSGEVSAADLLAEQMRKEEEALAAALPAQRAEAAALEQEWRSRQVPIGPPAPTPERVAAHGTVMPTSSGFMYVGQGIAPPEGGPLAAQRAMESAVLRQNAPEAGAAYDQLSAMGIQPPGGRYLGTRNVPMPMETPGQQREEVLNRYFRATGAGIPPAQAQAMSGSALVPQTGRYGNQPMVRNVSGHLVRYDPLMGAATDITPPGIIRPPSPARPDDLVKAEYTSTLRAMQDVERRMQDLTALKKQNSPEAEQLTQQYFSLADTKARLEGRHQAGAKPAMTPPTAPAAAPSAPIAPPARMTAPEPAKPVPSKKTDLVKGQVYETKRGRARWNGERFVMER